MKLPAGDSCSQRSCDHTDVPAQLLPCSCRLFLSLWIPAALIVLCPCCVTSSPIPPVPPPPPHNCVTLPSLQPDKPRDVAEEFKPCSVGQHSPGEDDTTCMDPPGSRMAKKTTPSSSHPFPRARCRFVLQAGRWLVTRTRFVGELLHLQR